MRNASYGAIEKDGTERKTPIGRNYVMNKGKEYIKINEWRKGENKRDISNCNFFFLTYFSLSHEVCTRTSLCRPL
jgi:hypothetical protein